MDTQALMLSGPTEKSLERPQVPLLKFGKEVGLKTGISQMVRCEKRRSLKRPALEECCLVSEKWGNLDSNILGEIFSRVPIQDLFLNVSAVCSSWEAACWDFLFWSRNVLDLSATGAGFGIVDLLTVSTLCFTKSHFASRFFGSLWSSEKYNCASGFFGRLESSEKYNQMANNLMRKLWRIMEGENMICRNYSLQSWRLSIETFIVPCDMEIADAHLLYIAERTPNVKQLLLLGSSRITFTGFVKAVQNWKNVKEIHLGPLSSNDLSARFIEEMGKSCQELEILHIHQPGFLIGTQNAIVIANSLPGLKKLEFETGYMFPSGVETFFLMCLQLEEVYFNLCRRTYDVDADMEASYGYENFSGNPITFRLSWSVDREGYAEWKVKPFSPEFESRNPTSYEDIKPEYQSEFDWWMLANVDKPRRQLWQQ